MIIKNPEAVVLGFDLLEWLIEQELCPKKEVKGCLRDIYESLTDTKVKVTAKKSGDEASEDEEAENAENGQNNSALADLKAHLLQTTYLHFSLTESGEVLLHDSSEVTNLLLTGPDAMRLLPKLKEATLRRADKLSKLMK